MGMAYIRISGFRQQILICLRHHQVCHEICIEILIFPLPAPQVHTFLVYSIALCTLAMTLEIFVRDDIRVHLFRCFSVWLQGAWFYAVGFILYPPAGWRQWDPESHHHGMMVTMLFTWNAAGVMGSMMLLAGLVYR